MLPMHRFDYDSVIDFVRKWSTDPQNPPYDFNGTVHLMLAALDNLREHAMEHELEDIGQSMTDDQRFFLKKIADLGCRVTDAEIEHEDDQRS
jgi:hypothetical protein